jgi:hypothetical protein
MDHVTTPPSQTPPGDAEPTVSGFHQSPEFRRQKVRRSILGILAIGSGVIAALVILFAVRKEDETYLIQPWSLLGSLIPFALGLAWYASLEIAKREYEDRVESERAEKLRAARDEALPESEAELALRLSANRDVLNAYQEPVRARARTSYVFAQIATAVGLIVLLAGAVTMLWVNDSSVQLGVAGLTAIGTALSGYIARTFLRVYERAQEQLNFYFREPLVTSYLLTAERLTEKLEGEKRNQVYAEMVGEIVRALGGDLSPTPGPDAPSGAK